MIRAAIRPPNALIAADLTPARRITSPHFDPVDNGPGRSRGHVGQRGRALRRDQRERAQLAGLDVRRGGRDADEHQVHVAGEHVSKRAT